MTLLAFVYFVADRKGYFSNNCYSYGNIFNHIYSAVGTGVSIFQDC